jgi:hypothetical protein
MSEIKYQGNMQQQQKCFFLQIVYAQYLFRPITLKCHVILMLVFPFCYFPQSMFSFLTACAVLCNSTNALWTRHSNLIRTLVFMEFFHYAIVLYVWF